MPDFESLKVYDWMRYSAVIFLVVNSIHRLANPSTGLLYMSEKFFWFLPLSHTNIVYIVMAFSILCAFLILLDKKTWEASSSIALGISFVIIMLFAQTPYFTGETSKMMFFDVALRDFGVFALFVSLSIMAKNKKID